MSVCSFISALNRALVPAKCSAKSRWTVIFFPLLSTTFWTHGSISGVRYRLTYLFSDKLKFNVHVEKAELFIRPIKTHYARSLIEFRRWLYFMQEVEVSRIKYFNGN